MDAITAILLFITGLIAGTFGGLLGIGGCVIMLPSLTFIFNYPLAVYVALRMILRRDNKEENAREDRK